MALTIPDLEEASITDLNAMCERGGIFPPEADKFKVGIVGAGVAGLFTAPLFDWLIQELEGKLGIDYDIIEAADESRLGERLFTHSFSGDEHDYYDVGAMRFPDNVIMKRTFRLFKYIGLEKNQRGGLVPYDFDDVNNVCPAHFNDVQTFGNIWQDGADDLYRLNQGLPADAQIPVNFLQPDPSKLTSEALSKVIPIVKGIMDRQRAVEESNVADKSKNWAMLMKMDHMSVRQFFSSSDNGKDDAGNDLPMGPGFNFNTIEWLETATIGTGWYDQSLTECIMEELDFVHSHNGFWCVDGGAQKIATLMSQVVNKHVQRIQFNSQVTAINANTRLRANPKAHVLMPLKITQTRTKTTRTEDYFAVFNSTTLGALQRMDLQNAGLSWGTKQAIRSLNYGASCKVAIKFKTPWWQVAPFSINKGGLSKTDLTLRVLALLHANDQMSYDTLLQMLNEQYVTHHAWDWYKDQNTAGAFAYFGPGQFSNMWQEIIKPNAFGQLYLIGEAASAHHGWIVGALESVVRAVYVMLEGLHIANPGFTTYRENSLSTHYLWRCLWTRSCHTPQKEDNDVHMQALLGRL
ncbi:hypothetical protein VSDG_10088 [Cytospora chrysosperma]|uniref:Amine oxidase domain-containing protein n=1 Tax=Cytospora chrysosperma TaxID=252740 RepID=A0A423V843_CYTCH|nr:hypothetical protein VSDG_10088 [Valsa sordida]